MNKVKLRKNIIFYAFIMITQLLLLKIILVYSPSKNDNADKKKELSLNNNLNKMDNLTLNYVLDKTTDLSWNSVSLQEKLIESNHIPTIVVGLMISRNVKLSRLNSFIQSWERLYPGFILKGMLVVGKEGYADDLVSNYTTVLDIHENVDEGKTFHWLEKAITLFEQDHPLNGIVKMDTDCAVNWTEFGAKIIPRLKPNFYLGRINTFEICGGGNHCPPRGCIEFNKNGCWTYMSGGWYALNLNIVKQLTQCEYAKEHLSGFEDLMVGNWIQHCLISDVNVFNVHNGEFFCHDYDVLDENIQHMSWTNLNCKR